MKRYRITRTTKTHVWIRNMAFGACECRPWLKLSRRMTVEEFNANWERVPNDPRREVVRRIAAM